MNKLKKQFSDLRKNTPKHIQWLLLAAAFVVVVILLILLLTRKDAEPVIPNENDIALELYVSPDAVDLSNVIVGETATATLQLSANAPVRVTDVRFANATDGLTRAETCTPMKIDDTVSCSITITYTPTVAADTHADALYIDWRGADEPDKMQESTKVILTLGAVAQKLPEPEPEPEPIKVSEPEPIVEPEPIAEPEPVAVPEPEQTFDQEPIEIDEIDSEPTTSFQEDLDLLLPENDFSFDEEILFEPTPVQSNTALYDDEPDYVRPPEACSDFAMPAYNLSGVQSGWIRPSGGSYYYHPFSDTECENPTGVYNPDNGIITDINNPGQKIGTDAEHIGYTTIMNGTLPQLSNPVTAATGAGGRARQATDAELGIGGEFSNLPDDGKGTGLIWTEAPAPDVLVGTSGTAVFSSDPFDRKFVLRQYKPIPATIVSEVRADPKLYENGNLLPVRATVDRNVYADDGRTIVIPTGTLMLGFVTGNLPGPYQTVGRMEIKWYQFILPSGVEFNFADTNSMPFSGDSQGRAGVPGYGSTDYVEQLVMPMITAIVPAAVNMIAPIADTFINQIDLDNNTVVQSGTVRSSELAKQELITAWNQVAQKLLVDAMDNTVPPFSIAAGTRITVYSPTDLVITCGHDNTKECSVENVTSKSGKATEDRNKRFEGWNAENMVKIDYADGSWVGQARSFNMMSEFCTQDSNGKWTLSNDEDTNQRVYEAGYDYRTVLTFCESLNYQAINNARQDALYQDQQKQFQDSYSDVTSNDSFVSYGSLSGIQGDQKYNEEVLGLTYDDGAIQNPFASTTTDTAATQEAVITCEGGALPDEYGCCPGETYTDMGEQGFNCCPDSGGDCFPPIL